MSTHPRLKCYTQRQCLEWIGGRVSPGQERDEKNQKMPPIDAATSALGTMVLAHVLVKNMNFRPKAIYLGTMTRRVLAAMVDPKMVDDRDYVGNKRLEL